MTVSDHQPGPDRLMVNPLLTYEHLSLSFVPSSGPEYIHPYISCVKPTVKPFFI